MKSIRETFEMLKPFYANPATEPKAYSMENEETKDCYREMQGCLRALLATKQITDIEYMNAERYLRDIHFNKQWYS